MLSRRASIALASVGVTVPAVALAQSVGVAPAIPESTDMDGTIPGVLGVVVSAVLMMDKLGVINIPRRGDSAPPPNAPTVADSQQSQDIAVLRSRVDGLERDIHAIRTDLREYGADIRSAGRGVERITGQLETLLDRSRGDAG